MHHPHTRAERRHAREVWRNHRRKVQKHWWRLERTGWAEMLNFSRGGKQYHACGNRCMARMCVRHEHRTELKRVRRMPLEFVE